MGLIRGSFSQRHPVAVYFLATGAVSWAGALAVAAPALVRRQPVSPMAGVLMFPAMLAGPLLASILLTARLEGRAGIRALFSGMNPARVPPGWWSVLLLPPAAVLCTLWMLSRLVSTVFSPNLFLPGLLFGVPAGLLEEMGWTGFAFPRMMARRDPLRASMWLGLLWSAWHLPVINYLGAATPHGAWWLEYFLAFALAMTAMRVLLGWLYVRTRSLLLAQILHISSTGALVVFSPVHLSAAQEAFWYAAYGLLLWMVVGIVVACARGTLVRAPARATR